MLLFFCSLFVDFCFLTFLVKEDEKRRQKEEERKQKEQQKKARKLKKSRDSSRHGTSNSAGGSIRGDTPSQSSASVTLEELAQSDEQPVPRFMDLCVTYIEAEGLATEGLYRVPGNMAQVQQLMEKFREGRNSIKVDRSHLFDLIP